VIVESKVIWSAPGLALALLMASRSWQTAVRSLGSQVVVPVSPVSLTTKVAADETAGAARANAPAATAAAAVRFASLACRRFSVAIRR